MKTALFTNFSIEEFVGYWDGKGKKFAPGQSLWMPDYLARHFAKHLVNRELLRKNLNGDMVYRDGEKMTSPKRPEDVPLFMELFNQAYTPDETEQLGEKEDDVESIIASANKNKAQETKPAAQDPNQPQVILPPEDDGDDDEAAFEGKPVETK